jgi:hypothetical protein
VDLDELRSRLDRLAELKEAKASTARAAKEADAEMKRYQADLYMDMAEAGMTSFGTTRGQFVRKSTTYGTIKDRAAFISWCDENGVTDDYIKEVEEDGRLNELVRSRLDTGEELPPGVDFYTRDYISHTKN